MATVQHAPWPFYRPEMSELDRSLEHLIALSGCRPERRILPCEVPLHVLLHGSGPAVLLLHGGSGGAGNWYRLIRELGTHARVIVPDLPGFGHSADIPVAPPLGIQATRCMVQLLDRLDVARADVVGTSFGGLAALQLARHFPERVRRLVLIDSAGLAAEAPTLFWWATRSLLAPLLLRPSRRGTRWALRHLLTSSRLPAEHERALVAYLAASARAHGQWLPGALRAFLQGRAQREWLSPAQLAAIAAPVLLLWGERDRFFPVEQASAALQALPHGELQVLPGIGHSPNWEAPEELLAAMSRFLFDEADLPSGG